MAIQHGDKSLRILLSGGGSGGHITPLLAVAEELKRSDPEIEVITIGERGSKFQHLTEDSPLIDKTLTIFAGKFRRYHGESLLRKLGDVQTNLLNLRDMMYAILGIVQSIVLVRRLRPDVVFLKGGFVGVPVGLAAALWKVPYVTHDSDALPGLANRIVGRWAHLHATGMPAEFYPYAPSRVQHVGVLVSRDYTPVDTTQRDQYRQAIGLPLEARVLFVTGGSLGSQRINRAVAEGMQDLLRTYPDLHVVHQVGTGNTGTYGTYTHPRLHVVEFLDGMYRYSGAADVIVTRAGANTIAEFGVQGKACIVVPSPFLAGGHQLRNGDYLNQQHAAVLVDEAIMIKNSSVLTGAIDHLLAHEDVRNDLAHKLQSLVIPDAAEKLARLLIEIATKTT